MKTISDELKAHLAEEVTTVAHCWIITRKDGEVFRFTDHDCDLTVSARDYMASASMASSDLKQDRTLSVDNMEAVAFLDDDGITDADLRARLFDGASVDLFLVNWADVSMGVLWIFKGWLMGNVELRDYACTVELRGLGQQLSRQIGDLYSETCRAQLGDAECGVDLEASGMRQYGVVASVTDRQRFVAEAGLDLTGGKLAKGILTWTGTAGDNLGLSMEVKEVDEATDEITLFLPMPYDILPGEEFELLRGCDKAIGTCVTDFDNGVNARCEPWLPPSGKTKSVLTRRQRTPWIR